MNKRECIEAENARLAALSSALDALDGSQLEVFLKAWGDMTKHDFETPYRTVVCQNIAELVANLVPLIEEHEPLESESLQLLGEIEAQLEQFLKYHSQTLDNPGFVSRVRGAAKLIKDYWDSIGYSPSRTSKQQLTEQALTQREARRDLDFAGDVELWNHVDRAVDAVLEDAKQPAQPDPKLLQLEQEHIQRAIERRKESFSSKVSPAFHISTNELLEYRARSKPQELSTTSWQDTWSKARKAAESLLRDYFEAKAREE